MAEKKRPNIFGDEEDQQNGSPGQKKLKPNARPPTFLPPSLPAPPTIYTPPAPPAQPSAPISAEIQAKRAEIQAKLAAMKAKFAGGPSAPAPAPAPVPHNPLLHAAHLPPPPPPPTLLPPAPPPGSSAGGGDGSGRGLDPELARKIAEARALVERMTQKKNQQVHNPYLSGGAGYVAPAAKAIDPAVAARGGLAMAAHPLLMQDNTPSTLETANKKDRYRPMAPKFSTAKANARLPPPAPARSATPSTPTFAADGSAQDPAAEAEASPYFDPRLANGSAGASGKAHMGRGHARAGLRFNQKGKFVQLGEQIRAEARMEELKKRILESAKKAGLESELEDQAKVIKRPDPPEVEWWDLPFLPDKDYNSFSPEFLDQSPAITFYVQHPIQIPAPADKVVVEPKALFLTKKEQKKMRRQRRLAALQDRQDRVKMGLLPPDPPKVKLSNMMRVLTQDAIADPTKVEAQVRREMVAREKGHIKANEARRLTDEQRREKREGKKLGDEARGIHAVGFKVRFLANPSHKFKVKKNAQDYGLTGVTVHNPKFCLVVVEGGPKAIKKYKQLMLHRIDWTEEARARVGEDVRAGSSGPAGGAENEGDGDEPQSLADNTCELVWEGEHKERLFGDFRNANCPSEASVRETLGEKLEGLWDVAKREVKEED